MNKKTNKIETPNKVKKGFRLYACTVKFFSRRGPRERRRQ